MKISHVLYLILVAVLAGCAPRGDFGMLFGGSSVRIKGSGNTVEETRKVEEFAKVHIHGSGKVALIQGEETSVSIRTDDNLLPRIVTEVSGDTLSIGPESGYSLDASQAIEYEVRFRNLSDIAFSGAVQGSADSISTDQLDFKLSGSGAFSVGQLTCDRVDANISGSGKITLGGTTREQSLSISGSGDYYGENLESQDASIRISGSGKAIVWVNGTLKSRISGSGKVQYYGSPIVDVKTSGSGSAKGLGQKDTSQ